MKKKPSLSPEEKTRIEKLFDEGLNASQIAEIIERAPQTVSNYLDKAGLKPIKRGSKSKGSNGKVCPKCKRISEQKGARFCWHCGSDIRSEAEILCGKLRAKIPSIIQMLPESMKNEASDVLQACARYLESEAQK